LATLLNIFNKNGRQKVDANNSNNDDNDNKNSNNIIKISHYAFIKK